VANVSEQLQIVWDSVIQGSNSLAIILKRIHEQLNIFHHLIFYFLLSYTDNVQWQRFMYLGQNRAQNNSAHNDKSAWYKQKTVCLCFGRSIEWEDTYTKIA
jgi:hypothetical protein